MDFFYHELGMVLPKVVAILPVHGCILMPHGQLPIPIYEKHILKLLSSLGTQDIHVGIVQPILDKNKSLNKPIPIFSAGTLGKITEIIEQDDQQTIVNVLGICRFDIEKEHQPILDCRRAAVNYQRYVRDLDEKRDSFVNREKLLSVLNEYFRQYDLAPNWKAIDEINDSRLITALSMVCPLDAHEKQALLEIPNLDGQSEMLTKFIEFANFEGTSPSYTKH